MKLSKKGKIGLIIGIIVVLLVAIIFVISMFLNKNKENEDVANNGTIEFNISRDENIIREINIEGKETINVRAGTFLVIVKDGKIVDIITQTGSFVIDDSKSTYYSVSNLQIPVNSKGTVIENGKTYNYEFIIRFVVRDPFVLFDKLHVEGNMKSSEVFERVVDVILRENVNKLILDYAKNEDISLSEVKKSKRLLGLRVYMIEELEKVLEEEYNGIIFESINFKTFEEAK